jgi:hypothetical protein
MPASPLVRASAFAATSVILLASLAGCAAAAGSAQSHKRPAKLTRSEVLGSMMSALDAVHSVHVEGIYDQPHSATIRVDLGLQESGALAGTIIDGDVPMSVVYVGGKLYVKATAGFLAAMGVSAACPDVCGRYAIAKPGYDDSLLQYIDMDAVLTSIEDAESSESSLTTVSLNGQRGYRWIPFAEVAGSYFIVSATPPYFPLKLNNPIYTTLTFSQWNAVPAPVAPPAAQVITGTW